MNDRVVIIPTYNEKENIENILRHVFTLTPAFDALVIEDNSPDGTAQIVKRLQTEFPQLHMIERKGKLGLGTAYIAGYRLPLRHRRQRCELAYGTGTDVLLCFQVRANDHGHEST